MPLGFNQGPGQALSFGRAWESSGLVDGGDIGIIMLHWVLFGALRLGFHWYSTGVKRAGWNQIWKDSPMIQKDHHKPLWIGLVSQKP